MSEFWSKVNKTEGCWIWQGCALKRPTGAESYGQLRWKGKLIYAHRLAWELINGPVPEGKEVCHQCDNPICCRPDHLFLGTHIENMHDAENKGRMWHRSGEDCYQSKLTVDQVKEIKKANLPQRLLAKQYHVSQAAIHFILNGKNWKEVTA